MSAPAGSRRSCPHAPRCVPCPLRGLAYREQLARKRARVEVALAAHGLGAAVDEPIGSRDLFGYRNFAKLAIRSQRGSTSAEIGSGLRAGVYEPGSHHLAEASACAVQHPALNEAIAGVLEEASALGLTAFDEEKGEGDLRYLVARYSHWTRRVLLVLVTGRREVRGLAELARRLGRRGRAIGGIVQNVNGERGNVILGRGFATLRPPARLVERIGFLKLESGPGSFLQANLWTARRIYETAVEWLAPGPADRVLDVFCGIGPLTLYLATAAREVVGVEEVASAVRDARANQRRNGFHNVRFHELTAEEGLLGHRAAFGAIDLVSLNPPRKGVDGRVLDGIAALGPRRILYVSCNPETLARDLEHLRALHYATTRVRPFDMMPQTDHVEVVALCERI